MPLIWIGYTATAAGFAWAFLGDGPSPAEFAIWLACIMPWIALGYAAGLGCRE